MSKMKFILLSLLAAFAVSAVGSATASATHNFKIEGTEIGKAAKEEVTVTSKTAELESVVGALKIKITCQEDYGTPATNAIEGEGKSKFEINFRNGCILWEISKAGSKVLLSACKVKEPIIAKGEDLLVGPAGFPQEEFKEKGKEAFAIIEITGGTCAIANTLEVKGTAKCSLPEAAVDQVVHEISCQAEGEELKLGAEPAFFYSEEQVSLKSLKLFNSE
jgi:hypothetical protein